MVLLFTEHESSEKSERFYPTLSLKPQKTESSSIPGPQSEEAVYLPSAEGFLGTHTSACPGKWLCHSPVNIFTKSSLDMLINTSAVTGGFPKPALPPLVFRSIYQVPPSSPKQRVERGDKAAKSAVPSLFLPAQWPLPCPFGAVTQYYIRRWCSARSNHLPHVLPASGKHPAAPRIRDTGRAQRQHFSGRADGSWRFKQGPATIPANGHTDPVTKPVCRLCARSSSKHPAC